MNYPGKFDAAISIDGQGSHSPADPHVDSFTGKPFIAKAHGHVPDGAVVVPDANLIFNGEFKRAGLDLVLSHDGHEFVVHDYFRGDKRAAVASPDGAHLTGDVVNALAGHVQYAQAASGIAAAQVIGHVTKLAGSATAIRNGVSVILNNGDNVEKGDVVSTGADSTLGITFIDGTVFGLSSNARMVLNEMVYDPNGSSNSSLLSLVAGTITFVAGETAKHGDMKIDTPVATMGIRGTAVLTQINFVVPAGGGDPQPQASFQVLVEPNGTTGSYILFDKVTLLPIATVNQAGQMIQISGGNVSISNALMSPDIQKLITDVFTLKFTDNNTNTKLTTNFTDTITQTGNIVVIKTDTGATATATFTNLNPQPSTGPGQSTPTSSRFPGPPDARSLDANGNVKTAFALTERADTTGDSTHSDTVSGRITFVDQNLGDRPTVSISLADAPNYVYKNAGQQDVTGTLSALQKQDIAATQIDINVAADAGNNNNGSAVWTYTIPDHVFDFLAAGETLTLTYRVRVNDNFAVNPESSFIDITITITGTNDKPVITTSVPVITFEGGTSVPGGPLSSDVPTSGTLSFKDVDLTDTHTVSVKLTSATMPDGTVPPGPLAAFEKAMSVSIAAGADSTGDGTGTIDWSLADLPVYLADFIPKGEVLTLVYTVTLTDAQGATSQQTITVTITGTDAPAVVWIATDRAGAPSGGFWKDAANWETGTVPTINDDVIVITDQLHGLTPSYPVTIDAAAYAKSITMNDFGGPPPEVINKSSLTVAGALNMSADSILTNAAAGTMLVGGKAEILDTSVLTNAGYLTLAGGGDFAAGTTITNSGTIELSAGTLKTLATIHNAGGTLKADGGTTLIVDGAAVDGGTVTILGTLELDGASLIEHGTLNNSGAVNVKGTAEFAHETVSNTATGAIKVLANGWLTIDQGSVVTNTGNVTVDASGKLTVNGASISGAGTVTGNGEIDLTGGAVLSGGILNNNATLNVSGADNALDDETVANAGTIEVLANGALAIDQGSTVDNASGNLIVDGNAALTLDHATISGGAIKGAGTIDVTGASRIDGGATLSISTVTAGAALTLDGVTVSGTDITDKSSVTIDGTVKLKDGATIKGGPITNNGTLEIAGAATLLNDVVTNTGHTITVDGGQTLTLSGTEISGGTIDNYSGVQGGTIDLAGNSKIDGNATLNKGAVTVGNGFTLTFGDATLAGTAIANHGTVKVDASKKLTLAGASLTGGALTVTGTLASSGTSTMTDASVMNNGLIEAIGGVLTLAATTSASIANADTLRANGAELDIDHEAVSNTGTLAAIGGGTLKLTALTVTNTGGTVSVESGSTLDLVGATVDGGTVTIAGTLESTGTSAINDADISNTGTISVTSGTLTIDPAVIHTITNRHLLQASGGVLDISGDLIVSTADIKAVNGGTLKLATVTVTNTGGTVTVDATSKLYLTDVSINGGSLSNAGNLYSVSGSNTVSAAVTNTGTGTIEVQAGTLNLSGGLSGVGGLIIDDGATLELAGATAQTVTFAGGTDTLQLDKVAGQSFTGTIAGQSSTGGTFSITGGADITTSSGNALGFTASGGTVARPADIILTPMGTLTGAANGVVVTQNGTGGISLAARGNITGLAGNGITLRDSATGVGNITVDNHTGKATGTGANSAGILVENLNSGNGGDISVTQIEGAEGGGYGIDATTQGNGNIRIDAGGAIKGGLVYGIRSRSYGSGNQTVATEAGSVITSASSGIVAANRATSIDASDNSTIAINAYGTINSGSSLNLSNNAPAGIQTGYTGATNGTNANTDVNGTVVVNNYANITAAAGYGIHAYNYGNGDVTVTSFAGTTISVAGTGSMGINATALSGGAGNVTVTLGENVTISGATSYGIRAFSLDQGDVNVTLAEGDSITSGSSGIVAVNFATAIADGVDSTISVEAHGTIHSGATLNNDGTTPGGIIAGYKPGGTGAFSNAVNGDVIVDSNAKITADAGYGIEAFTWGVGDITVTTGQNSEVTAAGTAIGAFDHGGGDVSVTNHGSATGAVALGVVAVGAGDVTILNDGKLTATGTAGIVVTQNDTGESGNPAATGSTHITNSGSVVGASGHYAIFIQENTAGGAAVIDNSGTIGPDGTAGVTATTYAIAETGGPITINNSHHINGNISVAHATFNNGAHGTWTVAGTSVFGNLSSIVNEGVIDLLNGAKISGAGLSISNSHEIDSWGTASISGTIANTDTIEVHDGALTLFGSLSGTGSVTVDAGALLKLDGTVSQTITLAGDGAELQIDTASFGGSIAALSATDTIDLSTIKYGLGTSAVYAANADPSTGGVLTVTDADGHHISLTLTGADYSHAHFAGSDDGTGHTLITLNAADDAPALDTAAATLTASFAERENTTDDSTPNPAPAATGSIHFTDIDLTDRPAATVTEQTVTLLAADGTTDLTASLTADEIAALKHALTYQQTGNNNGTVTWNYSIADNKLDFLGSDQKVKVVSTITLDDGSGQTVAADVTVTISGKNDAPTVAAVTTGPLVDTPATDSFPDITGTLVGTDADHGETATLKYAVLDASSHAVMTVEGHYGALTVYEDGSYKYVPHPAAINALSEGEYTDSFTVQTKDAQGATGTASFKVNVTGANDAPVITVGSDDSATATANETNAGQAVHGTLTLSDADTADHVSVALDHVTVSLDGVLQTDGIGGLSNADLLNYLTLPSGDILNGTATHAQFTWDFNSGSQAFDFLAAGQTLSLQYTIVPNDGHTTGAGETITINIAGSNDAPTLDDATLASVAGNESDPHGSAIGDLFADKFHDVDAGASFKAIAVSADNATSDQGVWQYEIAGTDQWVDISGVSDASALVLSTDTLIRFVPATGFSGTPGTLDVHALDDTYSGAVTGDVAVSIDISGAGHGGTTPVSDQAASIGTDVTVPSAAVTLDGVDRDGNAVENTTLVAHVNDVDAPTGSGIVYNFEVFEADHSGWVSVQHGNSNSYTPTESVEGEQIRVEVTYTDTHGQPQDFIVPAGTVQDDPNESAHVDLTGLDGDNAVDGTPVVATVTDDDAPSGSGITYIFQTYDVNTSSWSIVQQGGGNSYTPGESDDGKSLKVDVQFTDTHGNFETGTASAGIVQAAAPEPPPVVQDFTADAQVSSSLDSISGTLPGTVDQTVIGVSTDGVNFTPVTLDMSGKVTGTYFNFTVGADGTDTLQVGVPSYPDAASLIAAIEGNEHNSTPLTDTFYYELKDGDGNLTIDDITFDLTDLTFTGEIASHTTVGTPVSLGSLQVHDWGVTQGFDPSTLSVTVHVSAGVLWSSQFPAPGSSETFADDQTVTITGDQFQIEADLANLNLTSFAPGEIDVLISGVDGPARTPTYSAGSIDVSSPGYINIWTGAAADQSWNTNGNWSLGHIPTASETAVLDANGTVQLALDDNGYIIGGLSLSFTTELDIAGTGYNADAGGVDSYLLVNGQLTNASTIHVVDGTLEAFGHVTNVGTIVADGSYAMLDFANLTGSVIDGGDDGVIMAENGAQIEFGYNTVNGGAILSTGDDSIVHFQQTILNGTELYSNDSSNFEVDGPTTFNGSDSPISISGALVVETYGKLVLDGAVNDFGWIDNDGTMIVESGLTEVKFGISGSGTVEILAGTLEVGADSAIAVQFVGSGAGTLRVDYAAHFTGTVTGFGYGDTIDLAVSPDKVSFESSEGGLKVHYGSGDGDYFTVTGGYDATGFTTADDGNGGTDIVWSHQSPVIDTTHFTHVHDEATNTDTLTDLSVAGSSSEAYTVSAVTAGHADGTGVTPSYLDDLSLDQLNDDLDSGVTYDPGNSPPTNDKIAFTVTDSFGASDTVNFIFNEGGSGPVFLTGTTGKDVMFASESSDTLDGNGGQDQFVFTPGSSSDSVQHTILGFDTTLDKIDLRQFDNINSFSDIIITQQSADALVTLDNHESILLKNVVIGNLHASDFIVTNHSGGGII